MCSTAKGRAADQRRQLRIDQIKQQAPQIEKTEEIKKDWKYWLLEADIISLYKQSLLTKY